MSKAEFQDQLQHQRAKWTVEFGVDTSWEHHVAFSVLMLHSPEGPGDGQLSQQESEE